MFIFCICIIIDYCKFIICNKNLYVLYIIYLVIEVKFLWFFICKYLWEYVFKILFYNWFLIYNRIIISNGYFEKEKNKG